ncbi:MAG: glycine--tRNA ligase subunit beta [Desulfobacterales bacterium]|nr:glycine--tRNA ligase subunit beta [Desulfobacterales bacterium]
MTSNERQERMGELLLEIGTEEIPSDYLEDGLNELRRLGESYLRDNRIEMEGGLYTCGTLRRLVLVAKAIADKQEDTVQEMIGPPKKAAFDEEGNPTKAAFGFAKKQGVPVGELQLLETPKGEYLYVKRKAPGRPTIELLTEILPELIDNIPWPKSMRWGSGGFSFVRPIHWVLALFNNEVIPFEVGGVRSGKKSRGHRFMAPQIMEIDDLRDYLRKMNKSYVIIDQRQREGEVEKAVIAAAKTVAGTRMRDPELLSTVANGVEYPSAICGSFDKVFLNLPDPVLITAMKEHQRYFPIRDQEGRLMPNFVAVNNTIARDESIVRKGHERVLRARLADADFFFKEDRKRPLEDRLEDLKTVIYQAELGTSFAKVQRFTELAEYLAEHIAPKKINDVRLAARLCKCDLVTEMVTEFPSLQGTMGKIYATLDGHPEDVCLAIADHYLPSHAESELPGSLTGSIVGMADRMDTIVGCFAVGLEPTGTADPYALRRHALGIIRVIRGKKIGISLKDFVSKSGSILNEAISFNRDKVVDRVLNFVKDRFKNLLLSEGVPQDFVEAVLTIDFNFLNQVEERIIALRRFREISKDFERLTISFRRIMNIVRGFEGTDKVNPDLFEHGSEDNLWKAFQSVKDNVQREINTGAYFDALNLMAGLSGVVDEFFSEVMVMAEDVRIRENRLGMLKGLNQLFLQIADFSQLSVAR